MILHFFYDPLCGACHAVMPLIHTAHQTSGMRLELHAGGILSCPRAGGHTDCAPRATGHAADTAAAPALPFRNAYLDALPRAETRSPDPLPATAAIQAAEALTGQGLRMLARILRGRLLEGSDIENPDVLRKFAHDLQLPAKGFASCFESWAGARSQTHVRTTRQWMERLGVARLPALVIEDGETWNQIPIQRYVDRPALWREVLETIAA